MILRSPKALPGPRIVTVPQTFTIKATPLIYENIFQSVLCGTLGPDKSVSWVVSGGGSGEEGKEKLFKAKDRSHILFYTLFSQILARGRPQTTFNKSVENDCFLGQKSLGNGR